MCLFKTFYFIFIINPSKPVPPQFHIHNLVRQVSAYPTGSAQHKTIYTASYLNDTTKQPDTTITGTHVVTHSDTTPISDVLSGYIRSLQCLMSAMTSGPDQAKKVDITLNTNLHHNPAPSQELAIKEEPKKPEERHDSKPQHVKKEAPVADKPAEKELPHVEHSKTDESPKTFAGEEKVVVSVEQNQNQGARLQHPEVQAPQLEGHHNKPEVPQGGHQHEVVHPGSSHSEIHGRTP